MTMEQYNANQYWLQGNVFFEQGNLTAAWQLYTNAIKANPECHEAFYSQGLVLHRLGKLSDAISAYDACLQINPAYVYAWTNKGATLFDMGKYKDAIRCYEQALKQNPTDSIAHHNKGISCAKLRQYPKAIECYDIALKINSRYAPAYYYKGNALRRMGKPEEALFCYDAAISINQRYIQAYFHKGNTLFQLNRNDEAMACFNTAIRISPNDSAAHYNKGNALNRMGLPEEALESYNLSIRLNSKNTLAYTNKGAILDSQGKFEEALECYNAAIRANPDNSSAYNNIGLVLHRLGKYRDALGYYIDGIKKCPDSSLLYNNKGNSLFELGRVADAIQSYDIAIKLDSDNIEAYNNKGYALFSMSEYKKALKCYNTALSKSPTYANAHNRKGALLFNMENFEEALQCADAAIRLNPTSVLYLCNRGRVLNKLGDRKRALEDLNRAADQARTGKMGNNLDKNNIEYINEVLGPEREELIRDLGEFQSEIIKQEEKLWKILEEAGDDPYVAMLVREEKKNIKEEEDFIYSKIWNCIGSNNRDPEEVNESKALMTAILKKVCERMEKLENESMNKVDRSEIEKSAFKVNPEIEGNPYLKQYYSALYGKLYDAITEADAISGGHIGLDDANYKTNLFAMAITLIPMVGETLSMAADALVRLKKRNDIKSEAIKLKKVLGLNPSDRNNAIKEAAETITLQSAPKLYNIEINEEVEHWLNRGLVERGRSFFIVNMNRGLYEKKTEILGCIDALKIIFAIVNDQIPEELSHEALVNQLVTAPSRLRFTKGKKVSMPEHKPCCVVFPVLKITYENKLLNEINLMSKTCKLTGQKLSNFVNFLIG
ncbi:unnamed protein product [Blepharisma stoltei]|uniref:UDP-N-acetylglucosamine--peptide N-acetylglucosaminyltransferase SPINDLY n=1 Tax=Blepharisma stoltei TaxID=1481888 RepID=A0AAU9IGD1_9CILI|nr:unnamed protein product [Blepharisma stoltei]